MSDLGRKMHSCGIVLKGFLSEDSWKAVIHACVDAIGMTTSGDAAIWRYPTEGGDGGVGITICQPLVESFIVLDVWTDHDGAYLFICSCRPYFTADIDKAAQSFGLRVEMKDDRRFYRELNLA